MGTIKAYSRKICIQMFMFYRSMKAVRDRGREAAYCDKPVNRPERFRSGFSLQNAICRSVPMHCTVQFVACHFTCAVRIKLTFVVYQLSIYGGFKLIIHYGLICWSCFGVVTLVGVANNWGTFICVWHVCWQTLFF